MGCNRHGRRVGLGWHNTGKTLTGFEGLHTGTSAHGHAHGHHEKQSRVRISWATTDTTGGATGMDKGAHTRVLLKTAFLSRAQPGTTGMRTDE